MVVKMLTQTSFKLILALCLAFQASCHTVASALQRELIDCKETCIEYEKEVKAECFRFCDEAIPPKLYDDWRPSRKRCKDQCRSTFVQARDSCKAASTCSKPSSRKFTPNQQAACNNCPCCRNDENFREAMQGPSARCEVERLPFALLQYKTCRCSDDSREVCGSIGEGDLDGTYYYMQCNGDNLAVCEAGWFEGRCDTVLGTGTNDIANWRACEKVFSFVTDGPITCQPSNPTDVSQLSCSTPGTDEGIK